MDCFQLKRRKKKEREEKFRQLTPYVSPAHSQPSSLGHVSNPDSRLPKVGSNGLWVGTPGIYAATPSPAYYIGRPGKTHHLMQPAVMQRANSDTRLPLRGQAPAGPTAGSQQRIYHSQGLPSPLSPVYEVRDPRSGSVYDVYQFGAGSTSRLLQDGSRSGQSKSGRRLQRSQSDVVSEPARRPYRSKASSDELRASRLSSRNKDTAQIHAVIGKDNPAFNESMEDKILQEEEKVAAVMSSGTDSMKLLANNRTDDQKTEVVHSSSTSETSRTSPTSVSTTSSAPAQSSSLHYAYQGDIYAVPDKEVMRSRSVDRSVSPAVHTQKSQGDAAIDTPQPPVPPRSGNPAGDTSVAQNPLYQDAEEVRQEGKGLSASVAIGSADSSWTAADQSAAGGAGSSGNTTEEPTYAEVNDVTAASAVTSPRDVGAGGDDEGQIETAIDKGASDLQWTSDTECSADELSRAGKHISVTAEAFAFLNTYLSDDDTGDLHSPPKSPVLTGRSELLN